MISYPIPSALRRSFTCSICLALIGGISLAARVVDAQSQTASQPRLSSPPEGRSPVVLTAVSDSRTSKTAFAFSWDM
jgi:hypothetical protein